MAFVWHYIHLIIRKSLKQVNDAHMEVNITVLKFDVMSGINDQWRY